MDQLSYIPQQQRMAMNSISMTKGGNGNVSLVNINNQTQNLESINSIVNSIRQDIKHIKEQFSNLPPAPNNEKPPSPLARFQNQVVKIEHNFENNIGLNNKRVWATRGGSQGQKRFQQYEEPVITHTDKINELSKNVKDLMNEEKYINLTKDPENLTGHKILRSKYQLPQPNSFKYGRSQGGISNIELEKLGIGTVRPNKVFQPKRILPKNFRDDPFADPPPITENDVKDGMYSLLNRGIIPRDVDLTPAFERGKAPIQCKQQQIVEKGIEKPPQLKYKIGQQAIKYVRRGKPGLDQLPDPDIIPEVNLNRDGVFLTSMNVEDHEILRTSKQKNDIHKRGTYVENDEDLDGNSAMRGFADAKNSQISKLGKILESQQYQDQIGKVEGAQNYQIALYDQAIKQNQQQMNLMMSQSKNDEDDDQFENQRYLSDDPQFLIQKGVINQDNEEFKKFKRQNITKWGTISQLISQLEKFIGQFIIKFAYVSSKELLKYAELDQDKYTEDDLISCITNQRQVLAIINNPQKKYKGPGGPAMAAIQIQKNWRFYKARSNYLQLKFLMGKAKLIQKRYRLWQLKNQTQKKLKKLRADSIKVWGEMQNEFKKSWNQISQNKRIEIHINSFSLSEFQRLTIEKFKQKENMQISRIFSVKDPNVDVIYICPYPLTTEIYNYYLKILELVEIEEPERRFVVIVPENYVKFPRHFSLTQALLYSPRAMKQIKKIIEGQQCYIVPGKVSDDDIQLSIQLAVPILCGDPQKTKIFSTKSGAKRIFQMADIPVPIGAHDIYEEKDFYEQLTKLIANNLYINTWIFKIDDEFNGRGHASLSVDSVKTVIELRKRKVQMTEAISKKLEEVIIKIVPKKTKIAQECLYRSWEQYIQQFCKIGGVIEASPLCSPSQLSMPSVSFFIEPNGDTRLIGSFDRIESTQFVNGGCFFPQTSLPSINLVHLARSISMVLYEKGMIGHITVDMVSFPNPADPQGHPLFWAVDINSSLSDNASICLFFDILMEGKLDPETGEYEIESLEEGQEDNMKTDNQSPQMIVKKLEQGQRRKEPRNFMFCNFLHHPGLATIQYKTFFHMCRLEQVSFDMEKRQGSTFTMYDSLQSAVIGLLCIGVHRKIAVNYMIDALNFVQNQAGLIPQKVVLDKKQDSTQIVDVIAKVRQIHRAFELKDKKAGKTDKLSFIGEII